MPYFMPKKCKKAKNVKKSNFFVDILFSIWYITSAHRKRSAKMIFEN